MWSSCMHVVKSAGLGGFGTVRACVRACEASRSRETPLTPSPERVCGEEEAARGRAAGMRARVLSRAARICWNSLKLWNLERGDKGRFSWRPRGHAPLPPRCVSHLCPLRSHRRLLDGSSSSPLVQQRRCSSSHARRKSAARMLHATSAESPRACVCARERACVRGCVKSRLELWKQGMLSWNLSSVCPEPGSSSLNRPPSFTKKRCSSAPQLFLRSGLEQR